jgi:uncharacterized protein (UPF0335 family)
MTNETPGIGHNDAAARLRQYVSRFENLEAEIKGLRDDQKDLLTEAVAAGFDKKALRTVLRLRKMDQQEREEQEQLIDTYMRALGE